MILRKNACITSSPFHLSTFSPFSDCSAYAEHAEDGGGYGCDDFQDYRCCLFSFVAHWFWFFCFLFFVFWFLGEGWESWEDWDCERDWELLGEVGIVGWAVSCWVERRQGGVCPTLPLSPFHTLPCYPFTFSLSHLFTFYLFTFLPFLTFSPSHLPLTLFPPRRRVPRLWRSLAVR